MKTNFKDILLVACLLGIEGCDRPSTPVKPGDLNKSEESVDESMKNPEFQQKLIKAMGWEKALERKKSLTLEEAEKKWGAREFSKDVFKKGPSRERAQMAVDIVKSKKFLNEKKEVLVDSIGRHDGFFYADRVPAYILEEPENNSEIVWQLVFLSDWKGNITDYRFLEN